MAQFTTITSRVIPLLVANIDTDQIIPARFLKTTDKAGLGASLFTDWRYNPDGSPKPDFVLNRPEYQGAKILLAGNNFGCGSSREHAPWALAGFGFRAILSTSFADIFRNNALKNGLLPVVLDGESYQALCSRVAVDPGVELTIDLESQTVTLPPDGTGKGSMQISFPIDPFSKTCLLKGVDELGYLLRFEKEINAFELVHG